MRPLDSRFNPWLSAARRTGFGLALTAWSLTATACATWPFPSTPPDPTFASLVERVDALLAPAPFDAMHWGLLVVDADDGTVLYERNADRRFVPASNLKIPVTVGALGRLGPVYRWHTAFYSTGTPVNGVLDADLLLPATGDPTLGAPFFTPPEWALTLLADSLRAAGVQRVTGALVVDVAAWDSTSVPDAWMVGNLTPTYGATGGAFAVRSGELEIEVRGGPQVTWAADVDWTPRGIDLFVESDISTVGAAAPAGLELNFLPESRRWQITGAVRVNDTERFTVAARDPVRLGVGALHRTLADQGITLRDGSRIVWDPGAPLPGGCESGVLPTCPGMRRLAGMNSPPLIEVVRAILGPSQNWMTEQLVRTLGAEIGGQGSWAAGFDVLHRYLEEEVGIDPRDIHFRDGSGLSAYNLATPRALVRTLAHARTQSWGGAFRGTLASPGREGSTLESRLTDLEGRLFAKTGTISHVNALSGHLITDDGREVLFSIISNGSNVPAELVRDRIDTIIRAIAHSTADP